MEKILETLWSVLNNVSAGTRTASLAHRSETLDDHTNDNNWKKSVHIGEYFHFYSIIYSVTNSDSRNLLSVVIPGVGKCR